MNAAPTTSDQAKALDAFAQAVANLGDLLTPAETVRLAGLYGKVKFRYEQRDD